MKTTIFAAIAIILTVSTVNAASLAELRARGAGKSVGYTLSRTINETSAGRARTADRASFNADFERNLDKRNAISVLARSGNVGGALADTCAERYADDKVAYTDCLTNAAGIK